MVWRDKVAVTHGAGGAVGEAVAQAFTCEGVGHYLIGRHRMAGVVAELANLAALAASEQASGLTVTTRNPSFGRLDG